MLKLYLFKRLESECEKEKSSLQILALLTLVIFVSPLCIITTAKAEVISDSELAEIKKELNLEKFSNERLREVLDKGVPNSTNCSYGVFIINTIREADKLYWIYTGAFQSAYQEYFNYLLDSQLSYSDNIMDLSIETLVDMLPPTSGAVLTSLKAFVDFGVAYLAITKYAEFKIYQGLWYYLNARADGVDHEEAWEYAKVVIGIDLNAPGIGGEEKYENYFKSKWEIWKEYILSGEISEIREKVREEMRELVLSMLLPKAVIDAEPSEGYPPLEVHFDAGRSKPSVDKEIVSYHWEIYDDGKLIFESNSVEFSYTFSPSKMSGDKIYEVYLTVTDSSGESDYTSETITVRNPISAYFEMFDDEEHTIEYSPGPPNKTVYFDASKSFMVDGTIESYYWNFGDGKTAEGVKVNHTYTKSGYYIVTLTVRGGNYAASYKDSVLVGRSNIPLHVYGWIWGNVTWTEYYPVYVIHGTVKIPKGSTLRIMPGVVVKFESKGRLEIEGNLIADGTPDKKVIFTSIRDDSCAGDTNGDGNSTRPSRG
ncbi:MAG: hypothetical protein DRN64_03715, partial [Thaumarchaeota archaeon]